MYLPYVISDGDEFLTNRDRRHTIVGSQCPGRNKSHEYCNHPWKRSKRSARKQWARHPERAQGKTSPRFCLAHYAGDHLQFDQDTYEPHNLEDLGHEGVWNPPLPKGFNVITDESFDYCGNLRRPKFRSRIEMLASKECLREDAYEDPDRDDMWLSQYREDSEDDMRQAA